MLKNKKININFVVSMIVLLLSIIIAFIKLPASHVNFTLYFDKAVPGQEAYIAYNGNELTDDGNTEIIQEDKVNFFVYTINYNASKIELKYPKEVNIDKIAMSVRNKVSKEFTNNEIYSDSKIKETDDGYNILVVSDNFVKEYNKVCSRDFRLNLEIIGTLVLIYIIFMLRLVIKKIYIKYKFKGIVVLILLIVYLISSYLMYSNLKNSSKEKSLGINPSTVSDIITNEVVYKQSFTVKNEIKAINILMATHAQEVEGEYEFKLYTSNDELVTQKVIEGKDIEDNAYYSIKLKNTTLEKGNQYYYIINAINYNNKDKLCIYLGTNSSYSNGTLYYNDSEIDGCDMVFTFTINGPNRFIIVWISFSILVLLGSMCYLFKENSTRAKNLIIAIYIVGFIFSGFKMVFYLNNTAVDIYDELAQISYVAYLEQESVILPEFEEIKMLIPYNQVEDMNNYDAGRVGQFSGVYAGKFSRLVNYLGHPPLYYHIMRLTNSVSIDGDLVNVNLTRLSVANIILVLISIAIIFYVGFTRITKVPALHLLYVMVINSIHMLFFEAASVNNDNLALLGITLFIFGALRYSEKRYDLITYILVALGLSVGILSKLTTGIIMIVAALVLTVWTCVKEKSVSSILNKKFFITLFIYSIPVTYYLYTLIHTGSIQPSLSSFAKDQYVNNYVLFVDERNRIQKSFLEFVISFIRSFISQWTSGVPGIKANSSVLSIKRIGTALFWIFPILLFKKRTNEKEGTRRMHLSIFIGIVVTLLFQFERAFTDYQFVSGHASMQSRYYVCLALFFGLVVIYNFEQMILKNDNDIILIWKEKKVNINLKKIIICICLIYTTILFFEGFINLLINNYKYIIYTCLW